MNMIFEFKKQFVVRKSWEESFLKIALVYPNTYTSGMGGFTVQLLYQLFNQYSNVLCEQFFLPFDTQGSGLNADHPAQALPPIRSMENQMPLKSFDIIAFTIQYELDYPNILWILENSRIPLYREDRNPNQTEVSDPTDEWPIILVGGPIIRSNPLPIAKFIDLSFIGEIEPVCNSLIATWFNAVNQSKSVNDAKQNFLTTVIQIPGFWKPAQKDLPKICRVFLSNLDIAISSYTTNHSTF